MIKKKKKTPEQSAKQKADSDKMKKFFLDIWRERKHFSEISGIWLGAEPLTIFFHHILKSRKYPQAKHDKECIILLTFAEHQKAEQDEHFYEEINKRREYLKQKYNI